MYTIKPPRGLMLGDHVCHFYASCLRRIESWIY